MIGCLTAMMMKSLQGGAALAGLLIPVLLFVKDGVLCHIQTLIHMIISVVALDTLVIADEDHG